MSLLRLMKVTWSDESSIAPPAENANEREAFYQARMELWIMWITLWNSPVLTGKTLILQAKTGPPAGGDPGENDPQSCFRQVTSVFVDDVDNSSLKQGFSNIYHISGAHGYQQIAGHTIF